MEEDSRARIKLLDPLPLLDREECVERLLQSLRHDPGRLPMDEYCTNGGAAQDATVLAIEITSFGKSAVTGLLRIAFTEKFPVGCADVRLEDRHRIIASFSYRESEDFIEVDRGFPQRQYESEEF